MSNYPADQRNVSKVLSSRGGAVGKVMGRCELRGATGNDVDCVIDRSPQPAVRRGEDSETTITDNRGQPRTTNPA